MKIACSHCGLEFEKDVMIEDNGKYFCCKGCEGVYQLLHSNDLNSFYEKKGDIKLDRAVHFDEDSSNFDSQSFYKRFVKTTKDGFSKIDLIIEGIHCAACVWLNEKVLDKTDGIVEANINFSNHKATIIWDDEVIKLSKIIQTIRSIGYNAYPYEKSEAEIKAQKSKRDYFLKMSVAIFASMNIMMIDVAKYSGYFYGMSQELQQMVHFAEFIFASVALFFSGQIFFRGAYYGLKNKIINMDFLVITGASLAYFYSLYILFGGKGQSYFDSTAMIITFVLVGKYLEVIGKNKALDIIDKLKANLSLTATKIENNKKTTISVDEVEIGDILEVKQGEKIPVDGILIDKEASIDESSLTGESLPVSKKLNDKVYSGTINIGEVIRIKAIEIFANSTENKLIQMIEDSLNHKPKIEKLTNNLSKYFSITILTISLFTFFGWYYNVGDFERALIVAISVIVIACPCALALATPIATLVGIGELSKRKILLKEASFIETIAKIDTVIFDKTGTITKGELRIKDTGFRMQDLGLRNKDNSKSSDLKPQTLLYSLVSSSIHPVSLSIKKYLEKNYSNLELVEFDEVKQIPSVGIEAIYKKHKIFGGKEGDKNFVFKIDGVEITSFEIEDEIKEGAKEVIKYLKDNNIEVILCSGDNEKKVKNIANIVGIKKYYFEFNPIKKANLVEEFLKENKKVMMIGDGINDSLALSKSNVAIVMGSGADVSIAISEVVILNNEISSIKNLIKISKITFDFIKQNLKISLIYNSILIPIAVAGYVVPFVAAISMSISSLLVVSNSLRIKKKVY